MMRARFAMAALLTASAFAHRASAQEAPSAFACRGEALAIMEGLSAADMGEERDRRVADAKAVQEPPALHAHRLCVIAQLMSRLGDSRASEYFERAIASAPTEPGYELWYGAYLAGVRGATTPLIERAEVHLYRALSEIRTRRERGQARADDRVLEEWTERQLVELYQADGFPVSPYKAYPYVLDSATTPGLFLTGEARASIDTNDFVDVSDVRKLTSEAAFASSIERLDRPLTRDEERALVRAPQRYDVFARARLRQNLLGSLDLGYRELWIQSGQIVRFDQPNRFGDARVQELGVTYKRSLDLYPLADANIEATYKRVDRLGLVEYFPTEWEHFNLYELKPALSRFIGPDKLTVGMNFVYMDMPDIAFGEIDQRRRGRAITAFYLDYAIYRPLLLPSVSAGGLRLHRRSTRGWHFFGGAAFDNEVYGTRLVERRDYYAGTALLGMGAWDVTLQGTVFQSGVIDRQGFDLSPLSNAQFRTTLVPLVRIVDRDVTPGMPAEGTPAFLNLVFPMRWDKATQGSRDFENVRAGAELWTRFIFPSLRGTSFLLSGGYSFQYFYVLDKGLHMGRVDLGMGW